MRCKADPEDPNGACKGCKSVGKTKGDTRPGLPCDRGGMFRTDGFEVITARKESQQITSTQATKNAAGVTEFVPPNGSGSASEMRDDHESRQSPPEDSAFEGSEGATWLESDDTETEHSDALNASSIHHKIYITEFAVGLFNQLNRPQLDGNSRERIYDALPGILKAFVIKIGHHVPTRKDRHAAFVLKIGRGVSTQKYRDALFLIYKYRNQIAAAFRDKHSEQESEYKSAQDGQFPASRSMLLDDRLDLWFKRLDLEQDTPAHTVEDLGESSQAYSAISDDRRRSTSPTKGEQGDTREISNPLSAIYRHFILTSEAYEWLLRRLRREAHSTFVETNIMGAIGHEITECLQRSRKIKRKEPPVVYKTIFEVDWDILTFLKKQQYSDEPSVAIERALTLTGSYQDAQVVTCLQYVNQTWPITGDRILQLIKDVIHGKYGYRYTRTFPDKMKLSAWINGSKFMVEAQGVTVNIAEVGEQLAWLGAALRINPRDGEPVCCSPFITAYRKKMSLRHHNSLSMLPEVMYSIGFTDDTLQPCSSLNGQCWHNLFMNPVIVKGFPIPSRTGLGAGSEIPLNIILGLARTQRVDHFNGRAFIKGFSTMLVPTKRSEDAMLWHLIYNKDGSRISYLDDSISLTEHITLSDMEQCRHIVGWCTEAKYYAGSALANYKIANSKLLRPHNGCTLANTAVTLGKFVTGGSAFSLGIKDTPIHISRNGYIPRLQWIATKLVLFWDEGDKRGWLVNDKFKAAFVFNDEDLKEPPNPYTADSAIDVLINQENLALKLYREKDGFLLFESRVELFYNLLEKLIDHQAEVIRGYSTTPQPRRYLEGWDFNDLARSFDPLYPRVATLEAIGKSWVDFVRSTGAVTIFGQGFGELIAPSGPSVCQYWATVPKHHYYIAACLSDLSQLINNNDCYNDSHVRVSEDIIWHTPTTLFGPCRCNGMLGWGHCEPVQTLLPSAISRYLLPREILIPLESSGAVIFGHNSTFPWIYGDVGPPKEGVLPPSKEPDSDSYQDSGIGSSVESPGSMMSRSTTQQSVLPLDKGDISIASSGYMSSIKEKNIYSREKYTVGILCALPKELLAVRSLFDKNHDGHRNVRGDSNHYALGEMKNHMVVATCLPAGEYGTTPATASVSNMSRSFPNIRFCLLVGIGGGAPSAENDIRLGDVVVSLPTATFPGVIQYDRGKEKENHDFELTGVLQPPPQELRTAISSLRSDPNIPPNILEQYLEEISDRVQNSSKLKYKHPGQQNDQLFKIACPKCQGHEECADRGIHVQRRSPRLTDSPEIHYGLIASGNRVMKDAKTRDRWAQKYGVLCFEMEAAGIMSMFPCLVIRGICDYADSFKNDLWQEYAAATAAAYAKLLLSVVAGSDDCDAPLVVTKRSIAPEYQASEEPPSRRMRYMY
ncbi:pfs domain-containing [Trichoderma arundinaceum]|uniref:Pfs domain-containing n=1 Tax=Trichoderma arundinaceum TaxID=490622 RepID=A0A395NFK0_TRIAR|nr:pfs domain-containing [Trichoderma arundinaceum]